MHRHRFQPAHRGHVRPAGRPAAELERRPAAGPTAGRSARVTLGDPATRIARALFVTLVVLLPASLAAARSAPTGLAGGHHIGAIGAYDTGRRASAVRPVATADLVAIAGGTCTTCSNSSGGGGGGGGTGTSGAPTTTGTPYWETYRVDLGSVSETPASLVNKVDNWSSVTINGTFQYTRKTVRDVQFSGGYASFVRLSIGGEVSQSTTTAVIYPIPPRTYGKLYVKYRTERRTYYGRQYQDFSDGSRVALDADSGPYLSTSTVLGYVTGAL